MLSTHHILLFPQFAEMDKPGEKITALVPRVPEMHEVGCNWGAGSEAEGDTPIPRPVARLGQSCASRSHCTSPLPPAPSEEFSSAQHPDFEFSRNPSQLGQ